MGEAGLLLEKPNVYADFSAQTFLATPKALGRVLRENAIRLYGPPR